MWAGTLGLSLLIISTLLVSCAEEAPTRRKVGKIEPIATNYTEAFKAWNEESIANAGRPEDLILTHEEEERVRAMGLRIGSTWTSLSGYGPRYISEGVERRCKELGIDLITVANGKSLEREMATVQMFLNEKVDAVVGLASVDFAWDEAVESLYEAGIPVFGALKPRYSYLPTTCVIGDPYQSGAAAAHVLAEKIAAEGYTEAQVAIISLPETDNSCW